MKHYKHIIALSIALLFWGSAEANAQGKRAFEKGVFGYGQMLEVLVDVGFVSNKEQDGSQTLSANFLRPALEVRTGLYFLNTRFGTAVGFDVGMRFGYLVGGYNAVDRKYEGYAPPTADQIDKGYKLDGWDFAVEGGLNFALFELGRGGIGTTRIAIFGGGGAGLDLAYLYAGLRVSMVLWPTRLAGTFSYRVTPTASFVEENHINTVEHQLRGQLNFIVWKKLTVIGGVKATFGNTRDVSMESLKTTTLTRYFGKYMLVNLFVGLGY